MILLILILGFLLRLINLNQSLWLDEAITAKVVQKFGFLEIITKFSPNDFHPPLYYLFLKVWTNFFGYSEISLRFPSIIFSLITVVFIYLIAKKFISKRASLLSAFFLVINPLFVYYSQEARMYSMVTMLVTGAMYFYLTKRNYCYYLFIALAIYTDYMPILILPVFLLLAKNKKDFIKKHLLLSLVFLPWFPIFLNQFLPGLNAGQGDWGNLLGRSDFKNILLIPIKFIIGRINLSDLSGVYTTTILMAILSGIYLAIALKSKKLFSWLWLLIPIVSSILVSFFVPLLSYFRLLFIVPALSLLMGEASRKNKVVAIFISITLLLSLSLFNIDTKFHRENWREATKYVSGGQILMPSTAQSDGIYYYNKNLLVQDKTNFVANGRSPVYLIRYVQEIFDKNDLLRITLENEGYKKIAETDFNGIVIWKYVNY